MQYCFSCFTAKSLNNSVVKVCFERRVSVSGKKNRQNPRIMEVVRPFEPSSTVVHSCTTVEGEFCACTKHRCCMETLPSLAVLVEQPPLILGAVK